jgi:hypothetical protein
MFFVHLDAVHLKVFEFELALSLSLRKAVSFGFYHVKLYFKGLFHFCFPGAEDFFVSYHLLSLLKCLFIQVSLSVLDSFPSLRLS